MKSVYGKILQLEVIGAQSCCDYVSEDQNSKCIVCEERNSCCSSDRKREIGCECTVQLEYHNLHPLSRRDVNFTWVSRDDGEEAAFSACQKQVMVQWHVSRQGPLGCPVYILYMVFPLYLNLIICAHTHITAIYSTVALHIISIFRC